MGEADGSEKWIDAGLTELIRGGVDAVRVEVLAERMGVTKGGFYRRFKDRRALLDAMLDAWAEGRIAVIEQQTALDGETPEGRIKQVIKLYSERQNPEGIAIELAIRQWARADEGAREAAARVDAGRMKAVTRLYTQLGYPPATAEARAMMFYAFIFGESLLFLGHSQRRRAALVAACTEALAAPAGSLR
ncbi:MAG TPA: TetR/AcrR family transcriptional regulator [Hyphomonadaceae bacterium]|nr:TetR/AcrR family transcriptional regulator [Hyphomonadaceae bacterium]